VTNAFAPNIAPLTADYWFDGGIYRDVSLWAVDRL
jgi:beta-galactosidase